MAFTKSQVAKMATFINKCDREDKIRFMQPSIRKMTNVKWIMAVRRGGKRYKHLFSNATIYPERWEVWNGKILDVCYNEGGGEAVVPNHEYNPEYKPPAKM